MPMKGNSGFSKSIKIWLSPPSKTISLPFSVKKTGILPSSYRLFSNKTVQPMRSPRRAIAGPVKSKTRNHGLISHAASYSRDMINTKIIKLKLLRLQLAILGELVAGMHSSESRPISRANIKKKANWFIKVSVTEKSWHIVAAQHNITFFVKKKKKQVKAVILWRTVMLLLIHFKLRDFLKGVFYLRHFMNLNS